jgi:hypothetical protein
MVELLQRRSPAVRRGHRRPRHLRIVHRELPWAELAAQDEDLWDFVATYERIYGSATDRLDVGIKRALVVGFALSLLIWLVIAFTVVEVLAAT